jgi:CO dehydrogenase maturation factor
VVLVGNKVRSDKDRQFLTESLMEYRFLGFIPYDEGIIDADLHGVFADNIDGVTRTGLEEIARNVSSMAELSTSQP